MIVSFSCTEDDIKTSYTLVSSHPLISALAALKIRKHTIKVQLKYKAALLCSNII